MIAAVTASKSVSTTTLLTMTSALITPKPFLGKPKLSSLRGSSMGWWLLGLSAEILALLRLSVNLFQLRLTKPVFFVSLSKI